MKKIHLLRATFPYESQEIIGAFSSKASAEAAKERIESRIRQFDAKQDRREDRGLPRDWVNTPPHHGYHLDVFALPIKP